MVGFSSFSSRFAQIIQLALKLFPHLHMAPDRFRRVRFRGSVGPVRHLSDRFVHRLFPEAGRLALLPVLDLTNLVFASVSLPS